MGILDLWLTVKKTVAKLLKKRKKQILACRISSSSILIDKIDNN
jgi:hypothetical protein